MTLSSSQPDLISKSADENPPSFAESLPLITILSAVIGGVVLTVAAIVMMILCRRSSALTLKAMGNGGQKASSKAMTTTGTSTMSYAAGESVDLVKSSVGGGNGSTALLDASLANDSSQEWEGNEEDSGSLLRKQKPILQQQHQPNFSTAAAGAANPQMVRGHFCFSE